MESKFIILNAILDAKTISISYLYNYARTIIGDFETSSVGIKNKYSFGESTVSTENSNIPKVDFDFDGLVKEVKALTTSLNKEAVNENKEETIKLINNIIAKWGDKLTDENLKKDLATYFSSLRVLLALLELGKAINDYNTSYSITNYFYSRDYSVHLKTNILIVETFL